MTRTSEIAGIFRSQRHVLSGLALFVWAFTSAALDLGKAVVVSPENLSGPERKAVTMLVEEVGKRTQIRWERASSWPSSSTPVIAVGPVSALPAFAGDLAQELSKVPGVEGAEGYRICVKRRKGAPVVFVIGNDARGVLFGIGRLLRSLRMEPAAVRLPDNFRVASAPRYRLRGHQLGYRPKTNSYDAWD